MSLSDEQLGVFATVGAIAGGVAMVVWRLVFSESPRKTELEEVADRVEARQHEILQRLEGMERHEIEHHAWHERFLGLLKDIQTEIRSMRKDGGAPD